MTSSTKLPPILTLNQYLSQLTLCKTTVWSISLCKDFLPFELNKVSTFRIKPTCNIDILLPPNTGAVTWPCVGQTREIREICNQLQAFKICFGLLRRLTKGHNSLDVWDWRPHRKLISKDEKAGRPEKWRLFLCHKTRQKKLKSSAIHEGVRPWFYVWKADAHSRRCIVQTWPSRLIKFFRHKNRKERRENWTEK